MRILKFFIILVLFSFWTIESFAAINMTVSPIKYELEAAPWESITQTATIYNYDPEDVTIITWKSDFTSNWTTGSPSFVRYSELVHDDQELSSWMTLSSSWFILPANGKKVIEFTIDVPASATPGGHYAAVLFKNQNSETSSSWGGTKLWINVDYAVIILLTVGWDVVTEIEIIEPIVSNGWWWYSQASQNNHNLSWWKLIWYWGIDDCLWDFTNSNFDWICYDNPVNLITQLQTDKEDDKDDTNIALDVKTDLDNATIDGTNNDWNVGEDNNIANTNDEKEDNFEVSFTFPIKNTGNTHVKPEWSIKLIDENGDQIKGVWKKNKYNDLWAVIGVDVVDYLPINDNGGNVLPKSQRNFWEKWEWFPYQTLDDEGKIVMKNMSPDEYYTKQNIWSDRVLMPWERVSYRKNNKTIKALIDLSYKDDNWEDIEFSSAKEIPVTYTEKYIGINPYIVCPFFLFIGLLLLLWLIALWKRTRCINKDCKKRIKRKLVRCPYCDTKQKKTTKKAAAAIKKKTEKSTKTTKKKTTKNKKK